MASWLGFKGASSKDPQKQGFKRTYLYVYYYIIAGILRKAAVSNHSLSLHLQIQVKTMQSESQTSTRFREELMQSGKVCCGLTSPHLNFFSGKTWTMCKEEKDHPDCYQHLWWYGDVLVPMASWVTCTFVMASLMLKGTYMFWSNICCHVDDIFYRDKTMPSHILRVLQQRSFVAKECRYWTGLPVGQTNLPGKFVVHYETPDCSATVDVYKARMGNNSAFKTWTLSVLSSQTLSGCH